eukprot:4550146-Amphidinium_carterae.1
MSDCLTTSVEKLILELASVWDRSKFQKKGKEVKPLLSIAWVLFCSAMVLCCRCKKSHYSSPFLE